MSTVNNQTSESRPATTELMPAPTELRQEVAVAASTCTTRADDKPDWEVERGRKMVLHDDLICQILLWLPVITLLRLKLACRSWRTLIESIYFVKQHLHRHHYDSSLKDKSHNLIYPLRGKNSSITFASTSSEGFEEPNIYLQLNNSDVDVPVLEIVSYNGIICFTFLNCKGEQSICLWNPSTKKSRVLPQSSFPDNTPLRIGFGYDIKSNDYKVVKLNRDRGTFAGKMLVEVFSLNRSSWKRSTTVLPNGYCYENPSMPFNKGTCFFWEHENGGILCFDFSSEMFRSISLPPSDFYPWDELTSVVHDKIAYVRCRKDDQTEVWVFTEYGTVNESWTKLYTVSSCWQIEERMRFKGVSMNGNYFFFQRMEQMYRFNVVTKETNCFSLKSVYSSLAMTFVGFKESLVSV